MMNLKENEPFLSRLLTIKHSLGSGLIEDSLRKVISEPEAPIRFLQAAGSEVTT